MPKNNNFGPDKHDINNNNKSNYPNGTQWWDSDNLGIQKRDDQTIYDGFGNFMQPFSTGDRYINRRHLSFHALFYTQNDGYDASYAIGRRDKPVDSHGQARELTTPSREHQFSQELMGFHTKNEENQDVPTMQIYLFGYRDWEQILRVNDYVALRVHESYPDSSSQMQWYGKDWDDPDEINGIRERTLMCGLISDIGISGSIKNGRVYTITCQGMQKVLANVNLGLPKTAQWGAVNLLFDINGESNPANESFIFGSPSVAAPSKSSSGGGGAFGLSGVAGKICSYFSGKGCNKKQCAAIVGNAQDESGLNPSEGNGGLFQFNHGVLAGDGAHGKSVDYQCAAISKNGIGLSSWKSKTSNSSVADAASSWGSEIEGGISGRRVEYAENWYHKMH